MRDSVVARLMILGLVAAIHAAVGQEPPPPAPLAKARVFVYRPLVLGQGARPFTIAAPDLLYDTAVHVDGVQVAVLKSGGRYVDFALEPGMHRFYSDSVEDEFALTLEPGVHYSLRLETDATMTKARGVLIPLDLQFGVQEYEQWAVAAGTGKKERGKYEPQPLDREPPGGGGAGELPAGAPDEGESWRPEAPEGRSLLVVYRRPGPKIDISKIALALDGREVAILEDGEYLAVALDPGPHQLRPGRAEDELDLELAPSRVYYGRLVSRPGGFKAIDELVLFEEGWGERDLLDRLAGSEGERPIAPTKKPLAPELIVALSPP